MLEHVRRLVVTDGAARGEHYELTGEVTHLGRSPASNIVLASDSVSWNHATIASRGGQLVIMDNSSTNGTWVNNHRITGPHVVVEGDHIRLGNVALRLESGRRPPSPADTPPRSGTPKVVTGRSVDRKGPRIGKIMLIAGACEAVVLLGNVAASFFTQWAGQASWLAAPVVGVAVAMIQTGVQEFGKSGASAQNSASASSSENTTNWQPGKRPLSMTIVVALIVLGAGGWAVTTGVRYATGLATGNEPGVERLAQPVSVDASGLLVTVESVKDTEHFTLVGLVIRNELPSNARVALGFGCALSERTGETLDYDSFRTRWNDLIAAGTSRRGTIVFEGHLTQAETFATFSIATVLLENQGRPLSISVPDLRLAAVP